MNRYGRQAQEAWREASPRHYAQIQDPETFFSELGEQAATMTGVELDPTTAKISQALYLEASIRAAPWFPLRSNICPQPRRASVPSGANAVACRWTGH